MGEIQLLDLKQTYKAYNWVNLMPVLVKGVGCLLIIAGCLPLFMSNVCVALT